MTRNAPSSCTSQDPWRAFVDRSHSPWPTRRGSQCITLQPVRPRMESRCDQALPSCASTGRNRRETSCPAVADQPNWRPPSEPRAFDIPALSSIKAQYVHARKKNMLQAINRCTSTTFVTRGWKKQRKPNHQSLTRSRPEALLVSRSDRCGPASSISKYTAKLTASVS